MEKPKDWLTGFWSLFVVQFQGALSDNVFKFLVIFLLSNQIQDEGQKDSLITIVLATFSIPFILFSMGAGSVADRFSKRRIVMATKLFEVVVMSLGTAALAVGHPYFLIGVVFLMSVQSAFFGPAKYGLLPEMLPNDKLSWGNGMLGLGTFVSIITGGILAGVLYQKLEGSVWQAGLILIGLALVGLASSRTISRVPPANLNRRISFNVFTEFWRNFGLIKSDRVLLLAICGSTYFWFIGAVFSEPTILSYGQEILQLSETRIGLLRAFLALGIGIGSGLAGFLSRGRIEHGFILVGAGGLSIFAGVLCLTGLTFNQVGIGLGFLGVAGGFFIVPINALIQSIPASKDKGSVIATNNWLTSGGVFLASGFFWILKVGLDLEANQIFLVGSIMTAGGAILIAKLAPATVGRVKSWFTKAS